MSAGGEGGPAGRVQARLEVPGQHRPGQGRQIGVAEKARPADVAIAEAGVGLIGEAADPVAPVPAPARVGQPARERAGGVAQPARESAVSLRQAEAEIARIAPEGLVTADP